MNSIVDNADEARTHRLLPERAGDYVFVLEPAPSGILTIVDATDAAAAAHGYTREELIGRTIDVVDPFSTPEMIAAWMTSVDPGVPVVFTVKHRRKDGSIFDVEVRATRLLLDGRERIVSVERDIEKIRSSEQQLRHMHDLMSYVIGHARSAIAVHDRSLKYIYVSERYLREYGIQEQDVIGKHHYEVFPDLPQKWRDVHQRALAGEVLSAEEDKYERDTGEIQWTRWECRPWYEQDGSIGGIIVYTEVITERKRAEEERKVLEAKLQQAMKMEAVGRLAGGIAHDFNNLLTAILGNVSVMMLDVPEGDPMADLLRATESAAESAAALTRQLLTFSRKQVIEPRPVDLNDLVRDLQRMLVRLIGEDIAVELSLGEHLRPVNIDPGQFEQVLVNLVVNARDAMPRGGRISIETRDVELDEAYCGIHGGAAPGPHVLLAVSDTGHGMTDEVKKHLFEPFFTTKGMGRGTGLGLASTFGAVKQAGGSIEVYSEVNQGTTIKLYLPALEGTAARRDRGRIGGAPPTGHETILLVEDDERVRSLAIGILERLGYRVFAAADGEHALGMIETIPSEIDLLVTDVVMPGMNGRELAQRLKLLRPAMKVLFTSGYTENIIAHHGVVDPNVDFIPKPYQAFALAKKVRDVLDAPPQ